MGLLDVLKETRSTSTEMAACDNELTALEQHKRDVFLSIGQRYAAEVTASKAVGTPYASDLAELDRIAERKVLLEKRKLAIQGLRKCEKCGNNLALDSVFCNQCGEKLYPLQPEVFTDGPLCIQCKAPIEPGMMFCTKCGARQGAPSQQTVQPEMVRCSNCGATYELGTKFCVKCGNQLDA